VTTSASGRGRGDWREKGTKNDIDEQQARNRRRLAEWNSRRRTGNVDAGGFIERAGQASEPRRASNRTTTGCAGLLGRT
jgi:hypothetical protein